MSDSEDEILTFKTEYDMKVYIDLMKSSSKEIYYAKRIYDPNKKVYVYHPEYAILLIVNKDGTCNIKTSDNKIIKVKSKYIEHIPENLYSTSNDPKVYEKESYDNLDNFINKLKVKWNKESKYKRKTSDISNTEDINRKKPRVKKPRVKKTRAKKPRFKFTVTKSQAKSDINTIKQNISDEAILDVENPTNFKYKRMWNENEKKLFEKGLNLFGIGDWIRISSYIKSKTPRQVNNYFYNTFKKNKDISKLKKKDNNKNYILKKIKNKILEENQKETQKFEKSLNKTAEILNKTLKKLNDADNKITNLEENNKYLKEQLKQMTEKYNIQQSNISNFMSTIPPPNLMYYQPNPMYYQQNPIFNQQNPLFYQQPPQ